MVGATNKYRRANSLEVNQRGFQDLVAARNDKIGIPFLLRTNEKAAFELKALHVCCLTNQIARIPKPEFRFVASELQGPWEPLADRNPRH